MVDADSGEMRHLIAQLKVDSEFLENQREELVPIFDRLKERKVVSFYETMETPSVRMVFRALSALFRVVDYLLYPAGIGRSSKRWSDGSDGPEIFCPAIFTIRVPRSGQQEPHRYGEICLRGGFDVSDGGKIYEGMYWYVID